MDTAREQAALEIQRRRRLTVQIDAAGRCIALTPRGRAPVPGTHADPVEALEAAEAAIVAGEQRDAELAARRQRDALGRGLFVPWPRTNRDGQQEWLVLRVADREPVAGPVGGIIAALIEVARLNDNPPPPGPGGLLDGELGGLGGGR